MRILLADEHTGFQQAAERFLRADPRVRDIHFARSGAEAIDLAGQFNPDLALLDFILPQINGLWAALRITAGPGSPEVWMLTPGDNPEYEKAARASGAEGCIPKPDFINKIGPILQNLHQRLAGRSPRDDFIPERNLGESLKGSTRPSPERRDNFPVQERFIICRIGSERFGLQAREVVQVMALVPFTVLPRKYAPLTGILAFEGQAVPVIDLTELRGQGGVQDPKAARLIVFRSGPLRAGLMVDEIEALIPATNSKVWPFPLNPASTPWPYLNRLIRYKDLFIFLLDMDKIMADLQINHPGSRSEPKG